MQNHILSPSRDTMSNLKLQRWIAIASSVLLIAKFIAYYLTHSVSILTDALESIVNVVAGFIGFVTDRTLKIQAAVTMNK